MATKLNDILKGDLTGSFSFLPSDHNERQVHKDFIIVSFHREPDGLLL